MKVFKILLLVFWMILIFLFSNQNATESGKLSNGFIEHTLGRIYEIIYPEASKEDQLKLVQTWSYPVRKLGHFSVYLVLGIFAFLNLSEYRTLGKKEFVYLLLFCFLYAASDEIHQSFIPGRSCELKDVGIDTFGSLLGISSAYFVGKIRSKKRLKTS